MLGSGIAMWQICCRIVVSSSVGGVVYNMFVAAVRVVELGLTDRVTQRRVDKYRKLPASDKLVYTVYRPISSLCSADYADSAVDQSGAFCPPKQQIPNTYCILHIARCA